jgi:hypothetical protein
MVGVRRLSRRAVLVAVVATAVLPASAATAKTVPGVLVNVTITGQTTGQQVVSYPGSAADPDTGCPAVPTTGYQANASVHWKTTYRRLILTMSRASGQLSSRVPPRASGGATSGTFSLSGTGSFPRSGCWTAVPINFTSALVGAGNRRIGPSLQRNIGTDLFFLSSGFQAAPATFTLPGSGAAPDSVPAFLPFYLPPDALVMPGQSSKPAQAGFSDVGSQVAVCGVTLLVGTTVASQAASRVGTSLGSRSSSSTRTSASDSAER